MKLNIIKYHNIVTGYPNVTFSESLLYIENGLLPHRIHGVLVRCLRVAAPPLKTKMDSTRLAKTKLTPHPTHWRLVVWDYP